MIIQAITNNGQFAENVTFEADTEDEFLQEVDDQVEFVYIDQHGDKMREVWSDLQEVGYGDFGWTDFYKKS